MTASSAGYRTSTTAVPYPLTLRHNDGYPTQLSRNIEGDQCFQQTSVSHEMKQMDVVIASEIHSMEKEAYAAVMRALSAQSGSIAIDKLPLISELRKELRVSDLEEREILSGVESNDMIREIRQLRKQNTVQQSLLSKTKKASVPLLPSSDDYSLDQQMRTTMVPNSSFPVYHSHAQQLAHVSVVTHGNKRLGEGQLDSTPEIRHVSKPVSSNKLLPSMNRRFLMQTKNSLPNPCVGRYINKYYEFQVPATDKIIKKIEKIFKTRNSEPAVMKSAKLLLKNCEEALVEAIEKIDKITDEDEIPAQQLHEAPQRKIGLRMHSIFA
ncbi:hypothetical protein H6P81_004957 [Aristolochia fimbriata]|uniref:ENT domain-containing protein n=1 Tax=Aristolochia fimbriata TaxID=158543 RepID=A0AAV7ETM5_ARIFI|nr:hypothetical protein H6P81_004957 [Aristolochia fimbriata]